MNQLALISSVGQKRLLGWIKTECRVTIKSVRHNHPLEYMRREKIDRTDEGGERRQSGGAKREDDS